MLGRSVSTISDKIKCGTVLQKLSNGKVYHYSPDAGERVYIENRKSSVAKGIEKYSQKFLSEISRTMVEVFLNNQKIH